MLFCTMRSVLVVLVASAVAAIAERGLEIKLSGTDHADGVENLKVNVTVTNTGTESLELHIDPSSALHKSPTDTFLITHAETDATPSFIGIKVSWPTLHSVSLILHIMYDVGQVCA